MTQLPCRWRVAAFESYGQVPPEHWNSLADGLNPFVSLDFLVALEESGCAVASRGWRPLPLVVYDETGTPWASCPAYLKSHSQGEFVFDYSWAEAFHRLGGQYYPKLLIGVPFTPVPGPRILFHPSASPEIRRELATFLGDYLVEVAEQLGLSSVHCNFCPAQLVESWSDPWLHRIGLQFHWKNPGYSSFEDFLGQLNARKRKAVKKEREQAHSHGLVFEQLSGENLCTQHWDAFFRFYRDTTDRKWGDAHLNREFFEALHGRLKQQVVLMLARDGESFVAGALNLCSSLEWRQKGQGVLYGRNWGCLGNYPCLHFELCYYQAIEYAIAHRFSRVEAGAQGMHKVARGYLPVETHSLHYLTEPAVQAGSVSRGQPSFVNLVRRFLSEETSQLRQAALEIREGGPFRREAIPPGL